MAVINAKKISDLALEIADPNTDFLEISRDNGNGTFSSYRTAVSSVGGGTGTGEAEMVGEVKWFGQDPGAKWLPLDGSEIDLTLYPDVASSSMIRTLQAGNVTAATKTTDSASTGGIFTPTRISQVANTNTIIASLFFDDEIFAVDAVTETTKKMQIILDGTAISTQSIVYSFLDDGIDTYFILEDSLSGSFVFTKHTGLVDFSQTNIPVSTVGTIPFAPQSSTERYTGFAYDGARFYIVNYISNALWYSDDMGASFQSIPLSAVFSCGFDGTIRPSYIEYQGGNLIIAADLYVATVSVADLNRIILGEDISRPGVSISEYTLLSEGQRMNSEILNKNSQKVIVDRIESIDLPIFDFPYDQSTRIYYSVGAGEKWGSTIPCGFGFLQAQNKDGTAISLRYVDALGQPLILDPDVSGLADDGTGFIAFSSTQDKIFVFHDTSASSFDSMNVYDATITDVEKNYLKDVRDIDGAKAYLKVTV